MAFGVLLDKTEDVLRLTWTGGPGSQSVQDCGSFCASAVGDCTEYRGQDLTVLNI